MARKSAECDSVQNPALAALPDLLTILRSKYTTTKLLESLKGDSERHAAGHSPNTWSYFTERIMDNLRWKCQVSKAHERDQICGHERHAPSQRVDSQSIRWS